MTEFDVSAYNMLCRLSTQIDAQNKRLDEIKSMSNDGTLQINPAPPQTSLSDRDKLARERITTQINKESAQSKLAHLRSSARLGKYIMGAGIVDVMSNGIIGTLFDSYVTSGLAMSIGLVFAAGGLKIIPEREEVQKAEEKLIAATSWNYYQTERELNEKETPPLT